MSDHTYTFRLATPADAEALQAIYAPYLETPITNEYHVPTVEEFRARIEARYRKYPYIVCLEDGVPCGYSYASHLYTREGYDWSAELSVYMDMNCRGRGMGRQLYARMLELLRLQGIRSAMAKVTNPNPKSERLHESMGFRLVGVMECASFKCGKWHDISIYQKLVGDVSVPAVPFTHIKDMDPAVIQRVLEG